MGITWPAVAHVKSVQRPVAAALPLMRCHPEWGRRRGISHTSNDHANLTWVTPPA